MDERPDIQGFRAVALVLVLLSSLGVSQVAGGFVGIDAFFVLTGFLITGLLLTEATARRGIDVLAFYARRARRLLPMATLVLLATLVASFFLLDDDDRIGSTASEALWAAGLVANWKYLRDGNGYFEISPTSPLQHFWAVSVGAQFTLLWPVLLLLILFIGARRRPFQRSYVQRPSRRRTTLLGVVVVVLGAASLLFAVRSAEPDGVAYFSTLTRLWEFAAGALLALAIDRLRMLPDAVKAAMSWLGLIGVVASAVVLDQDAVFPGTPALLPVLATLLVVAGGVDGPGYGAGGLLSVAPLRWLGDRSYGIYLWHLPLLVLASAYAGQELNLFAGTVVLFGAVVLSVITYTGFERPLRTGPPFNKGRMGLVLAPVSVAVVAALVLVSQDAVSTTPPTVAIPPATSSATPTSSTTPAPTTPPAPGAVIAEGLLQTVVNADEGDPVSSTILDKLGGLAADTWRTGAVPCISDVGATTSELCFDGPEDAQTLVVFGDEHAAMWVPTLRTVARDSGWRFTYFVKDGCTASAVRLLDAVRQNREEECDSWRTWAIEQIIELAPDLTVVVTDSSVAVTGEGEDRLTAEEQTGAREAGLLETLQALSALPRVVSFSQTPVGPDPVACLDQPDVLISDCTILFGRANETLNTSIQRAVATSGTEYLDVTPLLCAKNKCPPINLADIIYSAAGQLTRSYALKLAPGIADGLNLT